MLRRAAPFLLLLSTASAQVSGVVVLVRTAAGDPARACQALWHEIDLPTAAAAPVAPGRTDDRGRCVLGRQGTWNLLVRSATESAVIGFLTPGAPMRVALRPAGRAAVPASEGAPVTWALTLHRDGRAVALPLLEGPVQVLPPGRYSGWVRRGRGLAAVAGEVRADQPWLALREDPPSRACRPAEPAPHHLAPAERPDLELPVVGARAPVLLTGPLPVRLLASWTDGPWTITRELRVVPGTEPVALPPPPTLDTVRQVSTRPPIRRTMALELTAVEDGQRVRWWIPAAAAPVPVPIPGDWPCSLTITVEGSVPVRTRILGAGDGILLDLAASSALEASVLLPDGGPAVGCRVTWLSGEDRFPSTTELCDRRGKVRFRATTGQGTLDIDDGEHLQMRVPVPAGAESLGIVRLQGGTVVAGTVVEADGQPVAGVLVTGSFPASAGHGMARSPRSAVTDDQGRFTLSGVDPSLRLLLAARIDRGPRTWTARRVLVPPVDGPLRLVLRSEDPPLPGRGKGQ